MGKTYEYWENKYSGKCWIVGNGPSLDVNVIDGPSFATNRIAMLYDTVAWRPTFFYAHAPMYSPEWRRDVIRSIELGIPCFIHERLKDDLGEYPNVMWITDKKFTFDFRLQGMSGFSMATLALYLGFDDLRFIGHDGYFQAVDGDDPNHFHKDYLRSATQEDVDRWNFKHRIFMDWIKELPVLIEKRKNG
jgi:hypothetical protein